MSDTHAPSEGHTGDRCFPERAPDPPPLFQQGKISIQLHHIGWIVSGVFTLIAVVVSAWLINKHLQFYTSKYEQRYIVRILFMVPIYALVSLASYLWWNHATPLLLIRDGYESTVLTAFFYLLLLYLSPDEREQKEIFRKNGLSRELDKEARKKGQPVRKWMLPMGFVQWKPADGLYFLQLMKWGVLQYCVLRPLTTLAAVILEYLGLYCEESWTPGWGHLYITIVVSLSVTVGMYCLIQLYMVVSKELAPQKPLLKLFAIKAVVFLTFWQATFLSLLSLFGIIKDSKYMTAANINIGIGALAECVEMALFALLHIRAFSYKPYVTDGERTPRWRSLMHAMNFKETLRELWSGTVYMVRQSRGHEPDPLARRDAVHEDIFGRSRIAIAKQSGASVISKEAGGPQSEKSPLNVSVDVESEVHVGRERQWIGAGDDYAYGLGYQTRRMWERSEGLEAEIEKELAKRGYALSAKNPHGDIQYSRVRDVDVTETAVHERGQRSWWRSVYARISQSGADHEQEERLTPMADRSKRRSKGSREIPKRPGQTQLSRHVPENTYDDPPPPSAIRTFRESRDKRRSGGGQGSGSPRAAPPSPLVTATFAGPSSPTVQPLNSPDSRYPSMPPSPTSRPLSNPFASPISPLTPPLLSPGADSMQADSFFDRAFANSVAHASSTDILAGPASSQTHLTHVALGSLPQVAVQKKPSAKTPAIVDPQANTAGPSTPQETRARSPSRRNTTASPPMSPQAMHAFARQAFSPPVSPPPQMERPHFITPPDSPQMGRPTFITPPDSPQRVASPPSGPYAPRETPPTRPPTTYDQSTGRRSTHRRESARGARSVSPPQPMPTPSIPMYPPASSYPPPAEYQRSSPRYSTPQYTPTNRYVPTRDRIVLPAPLAPAGTSPRSSYPTSHYPPSQSPVGSPVEPHSPPGLQQSGGAALRRDRRRSTPHSPQAMRPPR